MIACGASEESRYHLKARAPAASMDESFFASFFSKKEALPAP
jgi:hypothetical protein